MLEEDGFHVVNDTEFNFRAHVIENDIVLHWSDISAKENTSNSKLRIP